MTPDQFMRRLVAIRDEQLPLPGAGATSERHRRLIAIGREDVSVARLAEAHWDAIAILAEAGRVPESGALYGVWASEIPGKPLSIVSDGGACRISGSKMFCSGAGLLDRALVTVRLPEQRLVDVDLRKRSESIVIDETAWQTDAFRLTRTSTVIFKEVEVSIESIVGEADWYLDRPGFWHGACGPAACWAGGAAGLLDQAMLKTRDDAHTLAHLAAMSANVWGMESYFDLAGREIDAAPLDHRSAAIRALQVRHLVEQSCTDIIRRFARAHGPAPLSMDIEVLRRYQEVDLYLRQSHAERDLESLAHRLKDCQKW